MTGEAALRIALLARPGPACERLRDALQAMGGELVLDVDPSDTDVAALQAAAPQAVVVLLDPVVEDAIEAFDAVLSSPGIDVLYEEAELAAAREGWDVARWSRHLSAKLLRHNDVLPPRGGSGEPRNDMPEHDMPAPPVAQATQATPPPPSPPPLPEAAPVTAQAAPDSQAVQAESTPEFGGFDPVAAEYAPEATAPADAEAGNVIVEAALPEAYGHPDAGSEAALIEDAPEQPSPQEPAAAEFASTETARPEAVESTDAGPSMSEAPVAGFDADVAMPPPVDDHPAAGSQRVHDLAELERRIATMELVDTGEPAAGQDAPANPESPSGSDASLDPSRASDPVPAPAASATTGPGALLVLAGIGGPDAVRQLLAGLPTDFPRPVLVQQRLDGGRHDRLVQQMSRATELPVHLAENDAVAEAGNVYILPPTLGVAQVDGGLRFVEGSEQLIASLPAGDSAVLMFSGSDAGQVEAAMAHAGQGAFVAGQSPEGCYDNAAATALVALGGQSGQPSDLAGRLLQFWASRG